MQPHIQPLVSIIVPVYNAAATLGRCLASLAGQSLRAIQVVVVDDGSTDESPAIARRFAAQDGRFTVVRRPQNAGVSAARNAGLALATGTYVCFLDADDWAEPDWCAALAAAMAGGCQLAVCGYRRLGAAGARLVAPAQAGSFAWRREEATLLHLYGGMLLHAVWNKMYVRERIAMPFREDLALGEDLLFNLAYLEGVDTLCTLPQPLVRHYAQQGDSLSRAYSPGLPENALLLHARAHAFFAQHYGPSPAREALCNVFASQLHTAAALLAAQKGVPLAQKLRALHHMLRRPGVRQVLRGAKPQGLPARLARAVALHGTAPAYYGALRLRALPGFGVR